MTRAHNRLTLSPEDLRERTLSILSSDAPKTEAPTIKQHSKKYSVKLFTANDTSEQKYLLDVSVEGVRIRTKDKVFVRLFEMECIESIRLRKLPSDEHIMEIDFLRPSALDDKAKFGRVILLTDQGKAIIKEVNEYRPRRKKMLEK